MCDFDPSVYGAIIRQFERIREDATAPHVLMRPSLTIDGNVWCSLYGANLQDGVAGFGESPALAMDDFDRAWFASLEAAR